MKNILLFLLLVFLGSESFSRSINVVVVQRPCNGNGIIAVNYAGLVPGRVIEITGNSFMYNDTIRTASGSDTLRGWFGGMGDYWYYDTARIYGTFEGSRFFVSTIDSIGTCPQPSGFKLFISNGVRPYHVAWRDWRGTTVGTDTTFYSTVPGRYKFTIVDSLGCSESSDSITTLDSFDIRVPSIVPTITTTVANCNNGSATVSSVAGGTAPYRYLWNTGATTPTISGLSRGSVQVTVSDSFGCTGYPRLATINQAVRIIANAVVTPATCTDSNGQVIVFGSGGTPPYTYRWSNGATSNNLTGLSSQYLTLLVTDANGCTGDGVADITSTSPIYASYSTVPASCTRPSGSATLSLSGTTGPTSIVWYTYPVQTGLTASNLRQGSYYFDITDSVGCTASGTVTIANNTTLYADITHSNPICPSTSGTASVTASGSAPPFRYSWSTGSTSSTAAFTSLGSISVLVTDDSGCTLRTSAYIESSSTLATRFATTDASCIYSADGVASAYVTGGRPPYTYTWSTGATTGSISGLERGSYSLRVSDAYGCTQTGHAAIDYNHSNDSCYCTVKGKVFHDRNVNCTLEAGEEGVRHIQMHITGTGSHWLHSIAYTYTDDSGNYSFKLPTSNDTLSQTVLGFYPLASCQNNLIPITVSAHSGCVMTYNFADTVVPIHDMHVRTWDYVSPPVVGHTYYQITIASNDGTVSEPAVFASYRNDNNLAFSTISPGSTYSYLGSNYFNSTGTFDTIAPGEERTFMMTYGVSTSVPIGTNCRYRDTIVAQLPVSNWTSDYSPWNNVCDFHTRVVSSFDPNFKEVYPQGTGPEHIIAQTDTNLEYMIHFQNTGSWNAENIVVVDTLDPNIDPTSLVPGYKSHNCRVELSDYGVVKFYFDNINLVPQYNDELLSQGMFTYTVKMRSGLPMGTIIRNNADIYFDYNAPIKTNTAFNQIGIPDTVNQVININNKSVKNCIIAPNPASNNFKILFNNAVTDNVQITVLDIAGKVVFTDHFAMTQSNATEPIDCSTLQTGIYLVNIATGNQSETHKLVITK